MKSYTVEQIIQFIEENLSDIEKYESVAEKFGAYRGTLKAVKIQLKNIKNA